MPLPDLRISKGFYPWASYGAYDLKSDDPAKWKPVPFRWDSSNMPTQDTSAFHPPVWLYVLQAVGPLGSKKPAGGTPKLWRVYYLAIDPHISAWVWPDADQVKADPAIVKTPDDAHRTNITQAMSFPDWRVSTNEQYFYYFYVSRIPLETPDIIRALEDKIATFCPPVNLPDTDANRSFRILWTTVHAAIVPSFDPIAIAEKLHETYDRACDDYVKFNAIADDMTAEEKEKTQHRMLKEFLGQSLNHIFDNDPKNELKITDVVGTRRRIKEFVDTDVVGARKRLMKHRDEVYHEIAKWMSGPAWQFARSTYQNAPSRAHDAEWIAIVGKVSERASESNPGRVLLLDWVKNKTKEYVVNDYVLSDAPIDEARTELAKTVAEQAIALFKEIIPEVIKDDREHGAEKLAKALNFLTGLQLLNVLPTQTVTMRLPQGNGTKDVNIQPTLVQRNAKVAEVQLEKWFVEGKDVDEQFERVLTLINVGSALREAIEKITDKEASGIEQVLAGLKFLKGTAEATAAFSKVFGASSKPGSIKWIGKAGAVLGVVCATGDAWQKFEQGDYGATGGDLLITAGSILTLLVETDQIATPWGIVAAVLSIAGAAIVMLFSDTDIDVFVKHTVFGSERYKHPDFQPKWSSTNIMEWTDTAEGIHFQIDAFFRVSCGFEVLAIGRQSFRLRPNASLGDSEIRIKEFTITYEYESPLLPDLVLKGNAVIYMGAWVLEGDAAANGKMTAQPGTDGRGRYMDITLDWPNGQIPVPPNQSSSTPKLTLSKCSLRMDIYGDGKQLLPLKDDVEVTIYDRLDPSQPSPVRSQDSE